MPYFMGTIDAADPRFYDELVAMDRATQDALVTCICQATGMHPDDFDSDDWLLERLIARLAEDYKRLPPLE